MGLMATFMPPECKKEVNEISKQADEIYNWIVKKKCAECPNGVQANALMLREMIFRKCIDAYLDWLAQDDMDIDKICPAKFRRQELWQTYDQVKPQCVERTGEFAQHPNLCTAGDHDFDKTSECVKAEAMKIFKERATPPPMDCVSKAMKKCNSKDMGEWKQHFFVDMKGDPKMHEGNNMWVITNDFFKNGCSGKA